MRTGPEREGDRGVEVAGEEYSLFILEGCRLVKDEAVLKRVDERKTGRVGRILL